MFTSQGLNATEICEHAGISPSGLGNPNYRCATEKISALWNAAINQSHNAQLALATSKLVQPASFDAVGYAMMSCATLRDALDRLIRYLRIVSDAARVELVERDSLYWVELELFGGDAAIPAQRFVFDLLTLMSFCRWSTGRDLRPQRVYFSHVAPLSATAISDYESAFHSTVSFDKTINGLCFNAADLALPMLSSNPDFSELHDRFAGQRLEQLAFSRTSYRAREIIIRKLPDGEPRREDVALALCMSDRTLFRRFREEGVTYQQLLDDTRRELAQQYLRQKNLSLAQAAYLLGFADQSNFFRACKRWFDVPPGRYRSQFIA